MIKEVVEDMLMHASKEDYILSVDIQQQLLSTSHNETFNFEIDEFYKHRLLNGLDRLGYLLANKHDIEQYRKQHADKNFVATED